MNDESFEIIDCHAHVFSHVHAGLVPDRFGDDTFPVERLLQLMDSEEVSKAVLLQNPTIGTLNDEIARALEEHRGRLLGVIQVDPRASDRLEQIRNYASTPAHRTLKFEMSAGCGWCGIHDGIRLDEESFRRIWELAEEMQLNVVIDTGPIGGPGYQLKELDALTDRYADVRFLIEHLGFPTRGELDRPESMAQWREMISLALKGNVWLGFAAVPILLDEDYPCPDSTELLRRAVEMVGAERIVWGSDCPGTLRRHEYRELIDVVRVAATFLSSDEKRGILAENAKRLWPELG